MRSRFLTLTGALALCLSAQARGDGVAIDSGVISGLGARNIGSAAMSGRISALAGYAEPSGKLTVFVGAASGGVWKSTDGGTIFRPVFDKQPVQSIGAIAIDPSHRQNVWVGTGESWTRNSVSVGEGIYKSTDGGETWLHAGLADSERIAAIVVDPRAADTVYACVPGKLWSDSAARGLYRTSDGGKSWRLVLKGANLSTGCASVAMQPGNPDVLFASLWDFRRQGWSFRSGGTGPTAPSGSGLYRSSDGGRTWTELKRQAHNGLPAKPYGRIALAFAPSDARTLYAFIESTDSALFISHDGGDSWARGDKSQWMVWRPFYFANLIVDPRNAARVFKTDGNLILSEDGGHSFSVVGGFHGMHGDVHDVFIDPTNSQHVFAGDDGGLWISFDGGNKWWKTDNLPISQFYHVSVDGADPYHVYGGLQDNSSWVGDSAYPGGITSSRWENMAGGDGFWMFADPSDPEYLYAEAQGGDVGRVNVHTHETRLLQPRLGADDLKRYKKLRFNWNTPIALSPTDPATVYIGAQFLFRSRDHGQSWERISPDLTTNDPAKQKQEQSGGVTVDNSVAEMNTTVYSIAESPKNRQIIWAGTDDGNLQITRDGGRHWTNVAGNVHGTGKAPWVTWVEASRFAEGTAYATFDRHMYGDMKPYLYKTIDYGQTWTALPVQENGIRGYAHVIREDNVNPHLLFLGTEFGLWISVDGGERWAQYKGSNFPAVAVRDIVVHPRTSDLILATHGRGIWIIDNIAPWRALTPELMGEYATFLPMPPAVEWMETSGGWMEGDATFVGPNRPTDAAIPYYQRSRHIYGDMKIEVFDQQGKLLDTLPTSGHRGVNRSSWSMHLKPPRVPPAATAAFGALIGPRVLPGIYTVKMTKGDKVYTAKLNVVLDPRAKFTLEDRKAQFDLVTRLGAMLDHMSWAVDAIIGVRDSAQKDAIKLPESDPLKVKLTALSESADKIRSKIVATKEGGMITGEERLREFLAGSSESGGLYGDVNSYEGRPTASQAARAEVLGRELEDVIHEFTDLTKAQLPDLNRALEAKKLAPIAVLTEADWRKAHE